MGNGSEASARGRRFVFSERGGDAEESAAAASARVVGFPSFSCCRTRFTGSNRSRWSRATAERVSAGHFKPINSKRYVTDCHEFVFHFTKSGDVPLDRLAIGVPYQHKSNISRWGHTEGRDLRCRGNTWFIPYETIQRRKKERPHPATFPVQLAEWCIRICKKAPGR